MKNLILIASASFVMFSCNQGELDRSNQQKDSLMAVIKTHEAERGKQETAINDFVTSFNDVERNLDSVAVKQQIIYLAADKNRGEIKGSQKDRINAHIQAINELMDSNRKTIAELKTKLKRSSNKSKKLEEAVATLTEQLAQKDEELALLNEKLTSLNAEVARLNSSMDTLNALNRAQSQTIAQNTESMHAAYYLVGRTKDLAEAKVIDKKGGLLGIGKTASLNENFDRSRFTKIDYTKMTTIPVNSDKAKIITNHPTDSYTLEKDAKDKDLVRNIVITNPERFWSVSKYLVVVGTPTDKNVSQVTGEKTSKF
jgi:septal ring factor EnvC (AmiA/AmiB activator)